jgi:general secretion pathway protein H
MRRTPARGFTLIELVVVLAILGFALVLVTGYRAPWSRTLGLRGTAQELASALRLARSEAIAGNGPVAFGIDVADHRYRIGAAPPRRLPAEFDIALLTIGGERRGASAGDIRFNPDGSSTGGGVGLAAGPEHVFILVDWLTGGVRISDVR